MHPPPEFPAGLRVLLVDDDATCLKILDRMLRKCLYDVTTCSRAAAALSILREKKEWFDLVLSDVYMPDMDGFKLLEHIGLEMDLPVIMMSADDHKDVVMKGVTHGACDYIIKPVRMESLKNIWQHVVRKRRNKLKESENSGSLEESDKQKIAADEGDNASSGCVGNWKNAKRKKEGEDDDEEEEVIEEHEDPSHSKRPRVVWSVDLHQQFVTAVDQLGVDKAVPKKILELMNVAGLTRENVASHLQKYRLYLRRVSMPQHQDRFDTHFTSAQEATYNSVGSIDEFGLQALAVSAQLPAQSIAALHSGPRSSADTGMGISAVDQIGFLNSGIQVSNASNIISSSLQQMSNRQMSNLHGPSNIELSQLGLSQQMAQQYEGINLQFGEGTSNYLSLPSSEPTSFSLAGGTISGQLNKSLTMQRTLHGHQFSVSQQRSKVNNSRPGQPQSRGQLPNGPACHDTRPASTLLHQVPSNDISNHISERLGTNTNMLTSLPANYINASFGTCHQAFYDNSFMTRLTGGDHPSTSSIRATPQAGSIEALSSTGNLKGLNDHVLSYDMIGGHHDNKSQEWKSQKLCLPHLSGQNICHKQSSSECQSSLLDHQDSTATFNKRGNSISSTITEEIVSMRNEIGNDKGECIPQHKNTNLVGNSVRGNYDGIPDISYQNVLFNDTFIPNELMNVVQKQKQEGIGQVDTEFNFNIPV